jgi:hypothetical protein
MAPQAATGVEMENNEALRLGVEVRGVHNMTPPVIGAILGRVA